MVVSNNIDLLREASKNVCHDVKLLLIPIVVTPAMVLRYTKTYEEIC